MARRLSSLLTLASAFVAAFVVAGCTQDLSPLDPEPEPMPVTQNVILFFYSEQDLANAEFDMPVGVIRTVEGETAEDRMDAALRALFAGPDAEEQDVGARTSEDLVALGADFLGVTRDGDTAIVDFRSDALAILNAAAARQLMAKAPIQATLLQFDGVGNVEYAIDGEIFDEWDA